MPDQLSPSQPTRFIIGALDSNQNSFSGKIWILCLTLWFTGVCFLAVSSESFWIDEFTTTHFASQPSPRAMWQEMFRLRWPELQAPLYMAFMWCWQHLFGTGEWVSRFAGVPWFVLGTVTFVMSFRWPVERVFASLVVALNPFSWFYLNEARLYSFELGLTYLLIAGLVHLYRTHFYEKRLEVRWLCVFCLSVGLLSLLTVLGMIWVSAALLLLPVIFSVRTLLNGMREHRILLGSTVLALIACAGYYLWTRFLGTRAASLGGSDWRNLGFIIYEQLGFNGLGPGRLALRERGVSTLIPWLALLMVYAAAIGLVFVAAMWEINRRQNQRVALAAAMALAIPSAFLVMIGFLMNFRLLGRHCTPMVPVIVLLLVLGTTNLWRCRNWGARLGLGIFLFLCMVSCLAQRFAYRHAKDDYRSATQSAKLAMAHGDSVWWNAEPFGCEYYHLSFSQDAPVRGKVWLLTAPSAGFERGLEIPDWVIVSKPDVYDPRGVVQDFLGKEHYQPRQTLPAFTIFASPRRASALRNE